MKHFLWVTAGVLLLSLAAGAGVALRHWLPRTPRAETVGGLTRQAWMERLRSEDIEEGTRAWQALAELGEAGVPILLEARKDSDIRAHRRAALGLIKLGAPAVPGLIEVLHRGGDRVERILVRIGKPAVPALEKALQDRERAGPAARVLGGMGERASDAVPPLVALLLDELADTDARVEAAKALERIGSETIDGLEKKAADVSADPTIAAVTAALKAALGGPPKVQAEAARALAAFGTAGRPAVASLARLTGDKDAEVARAACEALGKLRAPEGAVALVARMQKNDAASAAAASALARLGPAARPALGGLIESLKSEKADAALARAVLERLGESAVRDLVGALKGKERVARRGAADVLGLMGPRAVEAAAELVTMLKDAHPAAVLSAASALVRIEPEKTERILAALEPLLTHKDEAVATAASAVLGDLGPDASGVVPALRKLLASKDEKEVTRAAVALGRIRAGDRETVAELVNAATKGPEKARPACVRALGRGGSKEAAPALVGLLRESPLRPEAAIALVRLDRERSGEVANALLDDIDKGDDQARMRAAASMLFMDPLPAALVPAVRLLLTSRATARVALAVLSRFDAMALKEFIPDLALLLGSEGEQAGALLIQAGQAARPAVRSALKARSPEARAAAAAVLGTEAVSGSSPDQSPLVAALDDPDESVRLAAAEAIAALGAQGKESRKAMLTLLGRAEATFRRAAAWALRTAEASDELAALAECQVDPDAGVRQAAVSNHAGKKSEPLEEAMRGDDLAVRLEAARKLGERGGERFGVLPFLLGILEGWDEGARRQAAVTLKSLGKRGKPALPALRRRVRRDDSDDVRRACEEAIKAIE